MTRIVLASSSPRRRELLAPLLVADHLDLVIRPADIDESVRPGEDPIGYVGRLSAAKAAAIEIEDGDVVIAADTTVDVDGHILGKPADAAEAWTMLRSLAGRDHLVHTGVTVRHGDRLASCVTTTTVTFAPMSDGEIAWYVGTGEPFDKAGAYAIQGAAGAFVRSVRGSVSNVVGLPLTTLVELAR
ncbi:MAG: nucleoside triphosphate pyrophosphatase, partial [Ilumatobacteraceae bacterium]